MNMSKRIGKRAFTLIELLVVIAIIALLAAILFPVFSAAREKGRQASCTSNLKQIGIAMIQYVQDNDECYPYGNGLSNGWAEPIYPYVLSTQVFACPDDPTKPSGSNTVLSYGIADEIMPDGHYYLDKSTYKSLESCQFQAPASSVMLFEMQGFTENLTKYSFTSPAGTEDDLWFYSGRPGSCPSTCSYATGATAGYPNTYQMGILGGKAGRHNGGANYLAADGHVKWLPPSRVSGGKMALGINNPQPTSCNAGQACASGTGVMNTGAGPDSATLTFSLY